MKSVRSSRGRFRTAVLDFIYSTRELGIYAGVSSLNVAHRVEHLVQQNRFLDGPSQLPEGPEDIRRPKFMYKSPVLKKAMEHLYTSEPWRSALAFQWYKNLSRVDPEYKTCPPVAFVAFIATAVSSFVIKTHITYILPLQYRNALDCLATGVEEIVPFSEVGYVDVYNDLYDVIHADFTHPDYGDTIRENFMSLIADVE